MRVDPLELKYVAVTLLIVGAVIGVLRLSRGEVAVCRETFQGLVKGRQSMHKRIDWERLKALDVDVGATYARLPNDQERVRYRRAFIESFSRGFRQTRAAARDFVRWRVHERAPGQVVVAADYPARRKTLLLTVAAAGKKLEGIQWQQ